MKPRIAEFKGCNFWLLFRLAVSYVGITLLLRVWMCIYRFLCLRVDAPGMVSMGERFLVVEKESKAMQQKPLIH